MMRKSIGGGALALSTLLATGVATATPPHGIALVQDTARGPAVGSGTMTIKPGTAAYVGEYALDPGASAGWRRQPGLAMLAVTEGTLRVVQAGVVQGRGCAVREYTAPEVAVLPAGTISVSNPGGGVTEFVGYFDDLPRGAPRPLTGGATVAAPKGCAAGEEFRAASTGVSAVDIARGVFTSIPGDAGHLQPSAAGRLVVPNGGDVVLQRATVSPGTSTGWYRHAPAMAFVLKGEMHTYEPTGTGCAEVEVSRAGDAVSHAHHAEHYTTFSGSGPVELVFVYWAMGNNRLPLTAYGNLLEANDFTVLPPPGCTVL